MLIVALARNLLPTAHRATLDVAAEHMKLAFDDPAIVAWSADTRAPVFSLVAITNALKLAARDHDFGLQLSGLDSSRPALDHSCTVVNDKFFGHFIGALTPEISRR